MAKKLDEILSESIGLSEDARSQIVGLWESKINEAREEVAATLREEFARKFQHDKGVLVESMDRFLTDKITAELGEFADDKRKLVNERLAYKRKMTEHRNIRGFDRGFASRRLSESQAAEAPHQCAKCHQEP